jgi:transposase
MAAGKARGEAWWRDCFQRYPQNGMAIGAFCKQEQVAISSFYTWKKRLSLKDKSAAKPKPVATKRKSLPNIQQEQLFIPIHIDDKLKWLVNPK